MVLGKENPEAKAGREDIFLDQLNFRYPRSSTNALTNLNISITPGVTGLVGVNGAGKSTLFSLIAGARKPTSGQVILPNSESSKKVAWVPQQAPLPSNFSCEDFLYYSCYLKGVSKNRKKEEVDRTLELMDLSDLRKNKCRRLSGGQAHRLSIAWALVDRPDVLLLDEPTAGLDIYQSRNLRNIVSAGIAPFVLFSSHILADVLSVSKEIVILESGEVKYLGKTAAIEEMKEKLNITEEEVFLRILGKSIE